MLVTFPAHFDESHPSMRYRHETKSWCRIDLETFQETPLWDCVAEEHIGESDYIVVCHDETVIADLHGDDRTILSAPRGSSLQDIYHAFLFRELYEI